jgi:hypothetical protein
MDGEISAEKAEVPGWKGLTGTQIKLLGVIMMVFDHLHQMFFMFGVPDWFTWIGRLVAPIFLFMCAEGFRRTRSKKRYMLLLFAGFEFMNAASRFLSFAVQNENVVLINNIFGTLLLCTIYMWVADALTSGVREKAPGKVAFSVLLAFIPIGAGLAFYVLLSMPSFLESLHVQFFVSLLQLIPNIATAEGGAALPLLGLLFYLFRERRLAQIAALAAIGLLSLLTSGGVQWMMVFAAIPIVLYNGTRGRGYKYFFYLFYPAHIYVFYVVSSLLA